MVCFFSTLLINFVGTSHVITGYDRFLAGRSVKLLHTKDGGGVTRGGAWLPTL